jgi:flagellar motility protein MotE (MotC chaperone)
MRLLTRPLVVALLGLLVSLAAGLAPLFMAIPGIQALAAMRHAPEPQAIPEKPWDFWTVELEALAAELRTAKTDLVERERSLAVREDRVLAARAELTALQSQLEGLQRSIETRLITITADEAKSIKGLAKTYSEMPPRSAAAVLGEMDEPIAVKVLSQMGKDAVVAIFDELGKSPNPALVKQAATYAEKLRLLQVAKP